MVADPTSDPATPDRRRPQAIVDTEIRLTREAMRVCKRIVDVALAERRNLLADGWPVGHALCEDLDGLAEVWSAQREHQRRALLDLMAEAGVERVTSA